jgi:hypothetical protein
MCNSNFGVFICFKYLKYLNNKDSDILNLSLWQYITTSQIFIKLYQIYPSCFLTFVPQKLGYLLF